MRRTLRMTWNCLAIALAIATLSLVSADLRGIDLRFSRHHQLWQLACSDGLLRLGNAPQIALEAQQIKQARDQRARDNDAREAETRHILRQAPWRSPAYEAALIKLKALKEGEAADAAKEEAQLAASRSQPIEHAISLRRLIVIASIVPAFWLIMMLLALRRRLKRSGWTRRQLASTVFAGLSALVFLVLGILWIRSYYAIEAAYYNSQEPQRKAFTSASLSAIDGNFRFARFEWIYMDRKTYDMELDLRSRLIPKPSEEPTAAGFWHRSHPIPPPRPRDPPFWRRFSLSFSTRGWSQPWVYVPPRILFGRNLSPPGPWAQPVTTLTTVSVPIWPLMLLCAIWPILWLRKMRRHLFAGPNRCRGCGYDIRASSDRCPECGRPFRQSQESSRKLSASASV